MNEFRYRAFISYAHADERWARWLQRELERYRPPRELGSVRSLAPVFRDREDLSASADLSESILAALSVSEHLVVICSPAAARSLWVAEEIRRFQALGRADRILCLIVDGEPGGAAIECLPEPLRAPDGHEPLAADLRPDRDGRGLARLKLIAGLLGVDLDRLRQRDAQRRQRRLLAIAGASLCGMVVMTALATLAYLARDDALMAREESELRQQQAEDLIRFMLGDLRRKLESVGRLDVLEEVSDAATRYFAAVPLEMLNDEELHQRARAIRQFGVDRLTAGDSDAALRMFRESQRMDLALVDRDPANADWGLALADDHYWVGAVLYNRDELDGALAAFGRQRDAVARVAALREDDVEVRKQMAYVRNNLGMLRRQSGDLAAALSDLDAARLLLDALVAEGGEEELKQDAIDASVAVADLEWRIGDVARARAILSSARAQIASLAAARPQDVRLQRSLGLVESYLARVLHAQRDPSALDHAAAEFAAARHQAAVAVDDPDTGRAVARAELRKALLASHYAPSQVRLVEAAAARDVLARLAELDDSDMRRRRDHLEAELTLAEIHHELGAGEHRASRVDAALAALEASELDASFETKFLELRASVLRAQQGDSGTIARERWRHVLTQAEALAGSSDGRVLLVELRARAALGLPAGASAASLRDRGWVLSDSIAGGARAPSRRKSTDGAVAADAGNPDTWERENP